MNPSFTEKALKAQEPIVESYVSLSISRLREKATAPNTRNQERTIINIVELFNYVAFDIVGNLCFGEPFECLKHDVLHPWIAMIFDSLQSMVITIAIRYYPWLEFLLMKFIVPESVLQKAADHYQLAFDKIHRRLNLEEQRDDFMTSVLEAQKRGGSGGGGGDDVRGKATAAMTMPEIESTFSMLIIPVLKKLTQEILTAFPEDKEITIASLKSLAYLNATISESLRLCNPVPAGIPYLVPSSGATVYSIPLPGGTHVSIYAATPNTHPALYHRSEEFIPERWLSAAQGRPAEYANDKLEACHPFGLPPRMCTGKGLAVA
ncbi:MAG: hypothetical protein Q9179_007593 [Wetmoreana sp. 5 TL-2023]